jgi:hypothetical protein
MNRRRKRRLPFAAYAALMFNSALCAAPFMAAHLVSSAYGDSPTAFETTPEALAATRLAMEERFQQIAAGKEAEPTEVWATLVGESLRKEDKELPLVRGLLLGAPAMLNEPEGQALRARIEKVAKGPDDEAVLLAAVSYLPGDLQEVYYNINHPGGPRFSNAVASPEVLGGAAAAATPAVAPAPKPAPERRVVINRVGSIEGLTDTAIEWANDDTIEMHAFLLSGIALILADAEAREGASVAMPALRARTQAPVPFKAYLTRRLEDVVNVDEMHRLLAAELHYETGYTPDSTAVVESAFRATVDSEKLAVLLDEFKILREIALDTSFEAAIAIVGRVENAVDLRAARLVAEAGGERAVALEHFDGENLLETARTVIPWTNALRLQAAGLAACLALLAFVALTTFWKSFRLNRPVRKSAVYLMEETPA